MKVIALRHLTGLRAGCVELCGRTDEPILPDTLEFTRDGGRCDTYLERSEPQYVMYREGVKPAAPIPESWKPFTQPPEAQEDSRRD